jgi:hypothetical protein
MTAIPIGWTAWTAPIDPYYSSVSLLLPMNGTNGSTTFTDYSPSPKTVTAFGNASISTAQYQWNGSSGRFDGSGDYLTTPRISAFNWWTSDYTIEYWINVQSFTTMQAGAAAASVVIGSMTPTGGICDWSFGPINSGIVRLYYFNGSQNYINTAATITASTWNHLAMVKTSSGVSIFINGVQSGTTTAVSGTPSTVGTELSIGQLLNISMNAYVNDIRLTQGVARYTSNFSVPTSPFPTS